MIETMSHVCIYVEDSDRALEFYTEKLGFEVCTDVTMEGMRWLTVNAPDQVLELVLMELQVNPMMDEETIEQLRELMGKGMLCTGVFRSEDCRATHAELVDRGVEFVQDPTERPYGIEAMFKDDSGNVFALVEPAEEKMGTQRTEPKKKTSKKSGAKKSTAKKGSKRS
jgi:predicted enzyme related to lactoylglutathione lyase